MEPEIKVRISTDVSKPEKQHDNNVRVTVTKHLDYDDEGILQLYQEMRKRLLNVRGDLLGAHALKNALREGWFYGDKDLLNDFNGMFTEEGQRQGFLHEIDTGIAKLQVTVKGMEEDMQDWQPFHEEAMRHYRLKVAKAKAQAKERGKK
jgi:hypothetical protein